MRNQKFFEGSQLDSVADLIYELVSSIEKQSLVILFLKNEFKTIEKSIYSLRVNRFRQRLDFLEKSLYQSKIDRSKVPIRVDLDSPKSFSRE